MKASACEEPGDGIRTESDGAGNVWRSFPPPSLRLRYLLGGGATVSAGDVGAFDEPLWLA